MADLRGRCRFEQILGTDSRLVEVLRRISQVADSEVTVLIQGESGTGKELIASALHWNSRRRDHPFVAINCGAFPEALLDSELFGHVRGAFTGAVQDKPGWLERAKGGTLFLDEIGEMPPTLQVKMLRVLESREYSRVGSTALRKGDFRVVAATHRNLEERVREGAFREDLLYRLNVVEIALPPLRERRSDILLLARHFLTELNRKHGCERRLSPAVERLLQAYDFPGNVRQLQNTLERAVLVATGPELRAEDLPEVIRQARPSPASDELPEGADFKSAKQRVLERFERDYVLRCIERARGNISEASRNAGLDFKNFNEKLRHHRIDPLRFRPARARE